MYIVELINEQIEIHNDIEKLKSGSIVKGINSIDSFSFSILPSNIGFDRINDFTTLIAVYNTNRNRYEFFGRVLYSKVSMESDGSIYKEVTCESYFGFLCDSIQTYCIEQNWTVSSLLEQIINCHNSQVEEYKQFKLGQVDVTDDNDNLYIGIQRETTWKTLEDKLIKQLGGEIKFRVEVDGLYLDYLVEIGETKATEIMLSKNMKSITKESDPSAYITRLIPFGCKLKEEQVTTDENGNQKVETIETENRLDVSSVNDDKNYIDDETAITKYGIHVGVVEWDDITEPINLLNKARAYLIENNKVQQKYSITALDLSLLGLAIDDFDICNYYPVKNSLLGIDDVLRVIKKTINICEDYASTIEVGDNFKTLSDIQIEQANRLNDAASTVKVIESNYVTNSKLTNESAALSSLIQQNESSIMSTVESIYSKKSETSEIENQLYSKISQTNSDLLLSIGGLETKINNVDGTVTSNQNKWLKYFRFSDDGLVIGEEGSTLTLRLNNDKIEFLKNGTCIGYWDGDDFHTGNIMIEVNERAQFGNFAFIPRSDGSLMFLKVGD